MIFLVCIIGTIVIGWFVPQLVLRCLPGKRGVIAGVVAALGTGIGFIWIAAAFGEVVGYGPSEPEFARGFNAWKIMLLWAPAAALHHHRKEKASRASPDRLENLPRTAPK
ncbi:MAG TPA: hypothetical protein VFJ13_00880 [Paracoccaceae bacterium]|nr:hypothetical protein [Paracoccaceae bacterium]